MIQSELPRCQALSTPATPTFQLGACSLPPIFICCTSIYYKSIPARTYLFYHISTSGREVSASLSLSLSVNQWYYCCIITGTPAYYTKKIISESADHNLSPLLNKTPMNNFYTASERIPTLTGKDTYTTRI